MVHDCQCVNVMDCCVVICPAATWVGGAFIVGTVEMVDTPSTGLTGATLLLLAYSTAFIVGKTEPLTASVSTLRSWKMIF